MPAWYPLIRAARYLGVAPWDLQEQHPSWFYQALVAERAEIAGAQHAAQDASRSEDVPDAD